MRFKPTIVSVLAVVCFCVATESTSAQPANSTRVLNDGSVNPDLAITSLQQLSELAHRLDLEKMLKARRNGPSLLIRDNHFTFYAGDLPPLTDEYGYSNVSVRPILIPLARLIQVQDLRRYLHEHPEFDPENWDDYLDDIEDILERRSLGAISANKLSSAELISQLREDDGEIDEILRDKAPDSFAQDHNLVKDPPVIAIDNAHRMPVSFLVRPSDARLWIVTETAFLLSNSTTAPWKEILEPKPSLGGCYRYRVIWSDQARRESRFCVERSDQVFEINR